MSREMKKRGEVGEEVSEDKLLLPHFKTFKVKVQGDQLYMAACFWYTIKSLVYACIVSYTGQVNFHKVLEKHRHFF